MSNYEQDYFIYVNRYLLFQVGLFFIGILFMLLYYRFFHVRRVLSLEKPANSILSGPHPPGVFNCRFATGNPSAAAAFYRKKKKPTTFVPPPAAGNFQLSVLFSYNSIKLILMKLIIVIRTNNIEVAT